MLLGERDGNNQAGCLSTELTHKAAVCDGCLKDRLHRDRFFFETAHFQKHSRTVGVDKRQS